MGQIWHFLFPIVSTEISILSQDWTPHFFYNGQEFYEHSPIILCKSPARFYTFCLWLCEKSKNFGNFMRIVQFLSLISVGLAQTLGFVWCLGNMLVPARFVVNSYATRRWFANSLNLLWRVFNLLNLPCMLGNWGWETICKNFLLLVVVIVNPLPEIPLVL